MPPALGWEQYIDPPPRRYDPSCHLPPPLLLVSHVVGLVRRTVASRVLRRGGRCCHRGTGTALLLLLLAAAGGAALLDELRRVVDHRGRRTVVGVRRWHTPVARGRRTPRWTGYVVLHDHAAHEFTNKELRPRLNFQLFVEV